MSLTKAMSPVSEMLLCPIVYVTTVATLFITDGPSGPENYLSDIIKISLGLEKEFMLDNNV